MIATVRFFATNQDGRISLACVVALLPVELVQRTSVPMPSWLFGLLAVMCLIGAVVNGL